MGSTPEPLSSKLQFYPPIPAGLLKQIPGKLLLNRRANRPKLLMEKERSFYALNETTKIGLTAGALA